MLGVRYIAVQSAVILAASTLLRAATPAPNSKTVEQVHTSAFQRDNATLKRLLATDTRLVNARRGGKSNGDTPLHTVAAWFLLPDLSGEDAPPELVQTVQLLLRSGAKPLAKDAEGQTPLERALRVNENGTLLHRGAARGDINVVKALLALGAEVDLRTDDGLTPLMAAAFNGRQGVAQVLIAKGADVNATIPQGSTVLEFAIDQNHGALVDFLRAPWNLRLIKTMAPLWTFFVRMGRAAQES